MNASILAAGILSSFAFLLHTFGGDWELRSMEPSAETAFHKRSRQKWTMFRACWHMVSVDLLLASVGLFLIYFTDYFNNEQTLLQILAVYFFGYSVTWVIMLTVSKQFPKNYFRLSQWVLLLVIGTLIYAGS